MKQLRLLPALGFVALAFVAVLLLLLSSRQAMAAYTSGVAPRSCSMTVGTSPVTILPANPYRHGIVIVLISSAGQAWLSPNANVATAGVAAAGSEPLLTVGAYWAAQGDSVPTTPISIVATASMPITCWEW